MRESKTDKHMHAMLAGIANRARISKQYRFRGLYRHLNESMLRQSFYELNRKAAPGVDKVTWSDYERDLDANLARLVSRLKRKSYRARLVRRHYIPKDGNKRRALGIPVLEDKIVQHAARRLLEAIYEADFYDYSFAYRPERSAKEAARELCFRLQFGRYGWIVECDVRGFFDNMDHDWTLRMLRERVDDRAFIHLIEKWLKAGVMEDVHTVVHPGAGTPQGGVVSPMLANIYLHYVLDLWFQKVVQKEAEGDCLLVRYADDFVCAFQRKADAEKFLDQLRARLAKFSLEVAEEKTRLLRFTRFETHQSESFEFLGFEFRWGLDRNRKPHVKRRTARKRLRRAVSDLKAWLYSHRSMPMRELMRTVASKLRGHWNYYGVHYNSASLWEFYRLACRLLFRWLNRRSQRRSYSWDRFKHLLQRHAIPRPRITEKPARRRYSFA